MCECSPSTRISPLAARFYETLKLPFYNSRLSIVLFKMRTWVLAIGRFEQSPPERVEHLGPWLLAW